MIMSGIFWFKFLQCHPYSYLSLIILKVYQVIDYKNYTKGNIFIKSPSSMKFTFQPYWKHSLFSNTNLIKVSMFLVMNPMLLLDQLDIMRNTMGRVMAMAKATKEGIRVTLLFVETLN